MRIPFEHLHAFVAADRGNLLISKTRLNQSANSLMSQVVEMQIYQEMHYAAKCLLENGTCEDLELLNALSSLATLSGWTAGMEWANKVREGKANRDTIRAALKKAKEEAKKEKATETAPASNVSHAKQRTQPPLPAWTIDDAIDDLSQALSYADNDLSAIDLLTSYTEAQRAEIEARLNQAAATGSGSEGFKVIGNLVFNGLYHTEYTDIDLLAMIAGYRKNEPINLTDFLTDLQTPRKKA